MDEEAAKGGALGEVQEGQGQEGAEGEGGGEIWWWRGQVRELGEGDVQAVIEGGQVLGGRCLGSEGEEAG